MSATKGTRVIFPKGSGISIRSVENKHKGEAFGASYLVTLPGKVSGRGRIRKQFTTLQDAKGWAQSQIEGTKAIGQTFLDLPDAERRDAVQALELVRGKGITLCDAVKFALPRMQPEGGDRTVSKVVAEIVASKERRQANGQLRPRSLKDFKVRTGKFVTKFGETLVKDIAASQIKEWIQGLGVAARTNKNYLGDIGEVFRYATQRRYVAVNPLGDLLREDLKELHGDLTERGQPNILTTGQAESLLNAALEGEHQGLDLLAAVTLGLFCGIRTEELTKLDWSHLSIDPAKPDTASLTVPEGIAKKRRIRHVNIPANALEWLGRCARSTGPITRNKYVTDFRKRFLKLQIAAGFRTKGDDGKWVSTWEGNNMRHSFGTYHFALHRNSLETARQMGHRASDSVLFDHYRALATEEAAKAYFNLRPPASKIVQLAAA